MIVRAPCMQLRLMAGNIKRVKSPLMNNQETAALRSRIPRQARRAYPRQMVLTKSRIVRSIPPLKTPWIFIRRVPTNPVVLRKADWSRTGQAIAPCLFGRRMSSDLLCHR